MVAAPQIHDEARIFDLAIVGGGVNGCGIARDAAGRGLSVVLLEQRDLASGTSSASTKLIHGGLRYLEHGEFRLVREALEEREVLWGMAPHIIWPLRFVLPHLPGLRPAWMLRLGLWVYDHLGGRQRLPATRAVNLRRDPVGTPLKPGFRHGFEYSDCWVDDARLVVLNALDAAARGACILPRTPVTGARRDGAEWVVSILQGGQPREIRARALVDAAGPWAGAVRESVGVAGAKVRLVQGSHIVVRRLFRHDHCYIFQNADRRIVFAIPYEGDFTLIGTTDQDYHGRPEDVAATADEVAYLCAAASSYFATPVLPADVVWTYSGVRPLYDDGASKAQDATRDYVLALDAQEGAAPLLTVYGGKITTYRRLAEAALERLAPHLSMAGGAGISGPWTAGTNLPGGDFPRQGFETLVDELRRDFPALDPALLRRLARTHGTRTRQLLDGVRSMDDLGDGFGGGLYQREVDFLMDTEWAHSADDVLWRRTKIGLRLDVEAAAMLATYMALRVARRK
ncbi:glycerol-3-phosphate dehydrogenase [Xanthobacter variabilis]|uniref:glycerol-3-phosphate dehydrogenase n=1 Tax=Xanthobacter variabilis TaxID=3119932 RepID=UPI00374E631E